MVLSFKSIIVNHLITAAKRIPLLTNHPFRLEGQKNNLELPSVGRKRVRQTGEVGSLISQTARNQGDKLPFESARYEQSDSKTPHFRSGGVISSPSSLPLSCSLATKTIKKLDYFLSRALVDS